MIFYCTAMTSRFIISFLYNNDIGPISDSLFSTQKHSQNSKHTTNNRLHLILRLANFSRGYFNNNFFTQDSQKFSFRLALMFHIFHSSLLKLFYGSLASLSSHFSSQTLFPTHKHFNYIQFLMFFPCFVTFWSAVMIFVIIFDSFCSNWICIRLNFLNQVEITQKIRIYFTFTLLLAKKNGKCFRVSCVTTSKPNGD